VISSNIEVDWKDPWGNRFSEVNHAISFGINLLKVKFGWQFIFISTVRIWIPYQVVRVEAIVEVFEEASCF